MRSLVLLLVLLSPQSLRATTIEVPLSGLDGFYANGDTRISSFHRVPLPVGEEIVKIALLLEGTTACGNTGCNPPVSFTWGSTRIQSDGGDFSFELSLTGFDSQSFGPAFPFLAILTLGVRSQSNGSISYNGFFGASAGAADRPPPPAASSPAIVTSATLVVVTAPVPEPGLGFLLATAIALVNRRGRS